MRNLDEYILTETDSSLSSEELSAPSKHDDWKVRSVVAAHKNTSAETLAELAKDEHEYVRENVAYNDNTPHEVLLALKNDKNVGGTLYGNSNH